MPCQTEPITPPAGAPSSAARIATTVARPKRQTSPLTKTWAPTDVTLKPKFRVGLAIIRSSGRFDVRL